jgi:hypothetical protein
MGPRQSSARKQDLLAELLDLPRAHRVYGRAQRDLGDVLGWSEQHQIEPIFAG